MEATHLQITPLLNGLQSVAAPIRLVSDIPPYMEAQGDFDPQKGPEFRV